MCIRDRLTGTEAGDRAVVTAQIVGDLNGVVLDGHIEVVAVSYTHLMTLHCSQMGFTEGLTFMMLNLLLVDALTLIWSAR